MAGSPKYKVFDSTGSYRAACKDVAAAALLMSLYGDGAKIRFGSTSGRIVWTEGVDGRACVSYDYVSEISDARIRAK